MGHHRRPAHRCPCRRSVHQDPFGLRPGTLTPAHKFSLPASAEGYAVDNLHGLFYTNLEEVGRTVAVDVRKRVVVSTWRSCDNPSGLAVDARRGFLFVACTDHVI